MASRILNPTEFADVVVLVHDLVARTRVDPDHLLLIGARCRDVLHRALGHGTAVRGTDDIDLGIAVESLSDYRKVVETLEPTGTTGARFKVHGLNVDIMPFGPIEDPRGTVTLGSRFGEFSVKGFTSVWANAQTVQLGDFASIRVPRVAGYAVLKAHAYAERAARFETKDAEDFATILTWYRSSDVIVDEVYNTDFGINVLQETDFDLPAATAYLLGADMLQSLPTLDRVALRRAWDECRDDLLISHYDRHAVGLDTRSSIRSLRRAIESDTSGRIPKQKWPL